MRRAHDTLLAPSTDTYLLARLDAGQSYTYSGVLEVYFRFMGYSAGEPYAAIMLIRENFYVCT